MKNGPLLPLRTVRTKAEETLVRAVSVDLEAVRIGLSGFVLDKHSIAFLRFPMVYRASGSNWAVFSPHHQLFEELGALYNFRIEKTQAYGERSGAKYVPSRKEYEQIQTLTNRNKH